MDVPRRTILVARRRSDGAVSRLNYTTSRGRHRAPTPPPVRAQAAWSVHGVLRCVRRLHPSSCGADRGA
eukprot:3798011-Pleurochrysis_carterae.AAC.1